MRITNHAKSRARALLPETRFIEEIRLDDFLLRLLKAAEILTPAEVKQRFPDFTVKPGTTYFVMGSLILAVYEGNLITVIDYVKLPTFKNVNSARKTSA